MKAVAQDQGMGHPHAVGLHRVSRPVVEAADVRVVEVGDLVVVLKKGVGVEKEKESKERERREPAGDAFFFPSSSSSSSIAKEKEPPALLLDYRSRTIISPRRNIVGIKFVRLFGGRDWRRSKRGDEAEAKAGESGERANVGGGRPWPLFLSLSLLSSTSSPFSSCPSWSYRDSLARVSASLD